ncbi:hypothetical protein BDW22DRAFT_229456 [Trametopsis cervina]|nr:hypothetical protein BDW22DRAFT_229456 [Trametopsis cervina]
MSDSDYRDWVVNVSVNPDEFQRSGHVHVFLSSEEPAGTPDQWMVDPNQIGVVSVFKGDTSQGGYFGSYASLGVRINGQVFLSEDLAERGQDINKVQPIVNYLRTQLRWRCSLVGDTEIPLETVPSLTVKVQSAVVHVPKRTPGRSPGQPRRGEWETHPDVTRGKVGGFSAA